MKMAKEKGFNLMGLMNDASQKKGVKEYLNGAWANANAQYQSIPLEKMIPNPANAEIYETADITELADSILMAGKVLQNAIVTEADADGNYMIIAGHRRRLACQSLVEQGHSEFGAMPCMVLPEKDGVMRELLLIQTNSTARILTDAEKMRQAQRTIELLTELKKQKKISGRVRDLAAKMLDTTTGQLGRYKVIADNLKNPELKEAFESGKMGVSAAYEAARLDEAGQAALAAKMKDGGDKAPTVRDAVEQQKKAEIAAAAKDVTPTEINGSDDNDLDYDYDAEILPNIKRKYQRHVLNIKKKYKSKATIIYLLADGKYYATYEYTTQYDGYHGVGSYPNPETDTPYDTAEEAISAAIVAMAKSDKIMHIALWDSGYTEVGEPTEEERAEEERHLPIIFKGVKGYKAEIVTVKINGKYRSSYHYSTPKHSEDSIKGTAFANVNESIQDAIRRMALTDKDLHLALWNSGYSSAGEPDAVKEEKAAAVQASAAADEAGEVEANEVDVYMTILAKLKETIAEFKQLANTARKEKIIKVATGYESVARYFELRAAEVEKELEMLK